VETHGRRCVLESILPIYKGKYKGIISIERKENQFRSLTESNARRG